MVLATTVDSKDPNSMAPAHVITSDPRLRYAYTKQRTGPCVSASTTSPNSATVNLTRGNTHPGKYTVTVHVTSVDPLPIPAGYVPLPASIGDASVTFTMWPSPALNNSELIHFIISPPNDSHAPVTMRLTSQFVPAVSGMRYIFTVYPRPGVAAVGTQDSNQSSYTFVTTIAAPSSPMFMVTVDEIRQSDCEWTRRVDRTFTYSVASALPGLPGVPAHH